MTDPFVGPVLEPWLVGGRILPSRLAWWVAGSVKASAAALEGEIAVTAKHKNGQVGDPPTRADDGGNQGGNHGGHGGGTRGGVIGTQGHQLRPIPLTRMAKRPFQPSAKNASPSRESRTLPCRFNPSIFVQKREATGCSPFLWVARRRALPAATRDILLTFVAPGLDQGDLFDLAGRLGAAAQRAAALWLNRHAALVCRSGGNSRDGVRLHETLCTPLAGPWRASGSWPGVAVPGHPRGRLRRVTVPPGSSRCPHAPHSG